MAEVWRYRVELAGLAGGPGLMTFHFGPTIGTSDPQDCVDAVAAFIAAIDVFVTTAITFNGGNEMEVIEMTTDQQTGTVAVTGFTQAGDDSATALPPATQLLVRWTTDAFLSGRRVQGKTFLPGFCEDSNETAGTPQAAVVSAVEAAARTLADAGVGLVVYSRTNGQSAAVEDASVWTKWAILAGRRDG
jgi:hypothetical protein